jgi:cell wall-associated NlpC family hydrolase
MKRIRLITIGVIALLLTIGAGEAFGVAIEASVEANKQQQVTQVTKQAEVINSQVREEIVFAGPVKKNAAVLGPVLKSDAPPVGSHDWMAQEKIEKDKLKNEAARKEAELKAEIARLEKIAADTKTLNETLVLVKNQIGITRWVFGGSTPRAWDCSGLVRWTYAHLDVDLRHSATAQRHSGTIVTEPKIGDLVSFNYRGWKSAYHIGIYLGPDEMIHSGGKPGDRTEIRSISGWAKDNRGSEVVYTRIIETNN